MKPLSIPALAALLAVAKAQLNNVRGVTYGTEGIPDTVSIDSSLSATVDKVYNVLRQVAAHSWEWGAQAEVATEAFYPELDVFSRQCPFPLCSSENATFDGTVPTELFAILDPILAQRTPGMLPIVNGDGAAGDPASLGIAAVLCGRTTPGDNASYYIQPAVDQLDFLLNDVPRYTNGAISHREAQVQLWADNLYMAPPFIAYKGVLRGNFSLVQLAFEQFTDYNEVLGDEELKLWHHIRLGDTSNGGALDEGLWSTGNGWALAGAMRILATARHLPRSYRRQTKALEANMTAIASGMFDNAWSFQDIETALLPNYFNSTEAKAFLEATGTAMITAATYRYAQLTGDISYIPFAERAFFAIIENNIDPDTGILSPVVNPLGWGDHQPLDSNSASPEGQAAVIAMISARNDWKKKPWE
ncbi:Six-hairpin glycosidase [Atractiella rhizophila]|nr:Six-hairpin glycosidase [Atractiella rhizophila]